MTRPVAGLSTLMSDRKDLRAASLILFIDERVRETVEVVDAKIAFKVRAAALVLDDEISHSLVLSQEGLGDCQVCVRGVVDRGFAEFTLRFEMQPVAHASRHPRH